MSGLRRRLVAGQFAVTAEIGPPRGAGTGVIDRAAEALRGWVDAANITDNQGSHVRLASWAGSIALLAAGVEPVMQLTCRDRNRIALQSDLLGAAAVGIPNVLLLTGDPPGSGDHPDAAPVFDLDSMRLLTAARTLRDEHRLLSGAQVDPAPQWFIGAVDDPFAPPAPARAERLSRKVAAGAEFVQTQFVFDVPAFATWLTSVRDLGVHERCHILAGVGVLRSVRTLDRIRATVPGVRIPDEIDRRLRSAPGDRVPAEGITIAVEIIQQLRQLTGVAGVHLLAFGQEHAVPEILERAGVGARAAPPDGAVPRPVRFAPRAPDVEASGTGGTRRGD